MSYFCNENTMESPSSDGASAWVKGAQVEVCLKTLMSVQNDWDILKSF